MDLNNGKKPDNIPVQMCGRVYPVTPDGSQWEVRVHAMADLESGREIIGEFTFRSLNGGLPTLGGMALEAGKHAARLIDALVRNAQENAPAIIPAREIPSNLKRRN